MLMAKRIVPFLCAAILFGCEDGSNVDPVAPDVGPAIDDVEEAVVVASVTGGAGFTMYQSWRTFSMNARKYDDDAIKGSFQLRFHSDPEFWAKGVVTCFEISGNRAWFGGTYTDSSNPSLIGEERVWWAEDNGDEPERDRISGLIGTTSALDYCSTRPEWPGLYELEAGNITIHR